MSKMLKLFTGLLLVSLVLAACGGTATETMPEETMSDEMCMGAAPGDELSFINGRVRKRNASTRSFSHWSIPAGSC